MANTNFTVHNGLTVGPTTIDAASGNITIGGSLITTGSSGFSVNAPAGSNGYGTLYANNYSGSVSAYVVADNTYVHFGSATATQLNWKVAGQTPAFIAANGTVIITGNSSLQSGGAGNLFVRNNTGSAVGMAITDAVSFHVGTVTNSQFNLKQNNTTQAYIDTTGNVNVVQSLYVTGNLVVSGSITTTGSNNITTTNKNLVLANNQSSGSGVDGAGIQLGSPTVVSWLYNNATTSWQSNVHVLPVQNNVWNLGGSSNYWNTAYISTITAATGTFSSQLAPSANASINLGTTSNYWNNVYAVNFLGTSTTAKYADLAERYTSDADYEPGTVVDFGGGAEVTLSNINGSQYVAGVVSTNPAYMMNSDADGLYIALTGRVPTKVTGPVRKGQMMVSNGDGTARAENNPKMGSVIGKALENFGDGVGVIEVVVGRL
jgi:hypothetical protein